MSENTIIGLNSGKNAHCLLNSTFVGCRAGENDTKGVSNVYIGHSAGKNTRNSKNNVFIGSNTGKSQNGTDNIYIGCDTGHVAVGDNNILIGKHLTSAISNQIKIGNTSTVTNRSIIEAESSDNGNEMSLDADVSVHGICKSTSIVLNVYDSIHAINPVQGQLLIHKDQGKIKLCVYVDDRWVYFENIS